VLVHGSSSCCCMAATAAAAEEGGEARRGWYMAAAAAAMWGLWKQWLSLRGSSRSRDEGRSVAAWQLHEEGASSGCCMVAAAAAAGDRSTDWWEHKWEMPKQVAIGHGWCVYALGDVLCVCLPSLPPSSDGLAVDRMVDAW
jgi:hypothetical protein